MGQLRHDAACGVEHIDECWVFLLGLFFEEESVGCRGAAFDVAVV